MNAALFELDEPVFNFTSPLPSSTEIEIRLLLTANSLSHLQKAFGLSDENAKRFDVSFHDTSDLAFLGHGVVLRTRTIQDADMEAKVRLRGTGAPFDSKQFDVEHHIDWDGKQQLHSYSTTCRSSASQCAENALSAKCPACALFSEEQRKFLEMCIPELAGRFQWQNVRRFGPAQGMLWKEIHAPQIGRKITVEHWKMRSRWRTSEFIEVSTKAKSLTLRQAADLATEFYRLLEMHGFRRDTGTPFKENRMLHFFRPGI